ncbi:MAG: hypothetical protein R3F18_14580 [Lysobacterales bacterium]
MTRLKAFRVHLLASACVGAVVATLVFFLWYPDFYFKASGAQILIATLIFVDVVIGPALTLLLFKPGKWGLAFDMTVILILQLCALLYGLSVIIGSRPVFMVAAVDRFVVVSANQIDRDEMPDDANSRFSQLSWTGPRLVGLQLPEDLQERNRLTLLDVAGQRRGPSCMCPAEICRYPDGQGQALRGAAARRSRMRSWPVNGYSDPV